MNPPRRRLLLALGGAPWLVACGFQLRQAPEFGFRRIALAMPATALATELRRQLQGTGRVEVLADAAKAGAGDVVLKGVVAALMRQVRSSDVVGRLGGDDGVLQLASRHVGQSVGIYASLFSNDVDHLAGDIAAGAAEFFGKRNAHHAEAGHFFDGADRKSFFFVGFTGKGAHFVFGEVFEGSCEKLVFPAELKIHGALLVFGWASDVEGEIADTG